MNEFVARFEIVLWVLEGRTSLLLVVAAAAAVELQATQLDSVFSPLIPQYFYNIMLDKSTEWNDGLTYVLVGAFLFFAVFSGNTQSLLDLKHLEVSSVQVSSTKSMCIKEPLP